MTTTIEKDTAVGVDPYSRPNAQFVEDGVLEIRASAVADCRRALWYAATGHPVTNPPADSVLTVMEAGTALEPVVLRAMERAGWEIHPADRQNPQRVSVPIGPTMRLTGHPDATGVMPIFGGEAVIEVKTRNPDAFKRWQVLGAERSHPNTVRSGGSLHARNLRRDAGCGHRLHGHRLTNVGLRDHPRRAT